MEKHKNKYRTTSHRMRGWDYSAGGYYFITMVTQNRICNLGKIENNKMILSEFGKIVETQWHKSFKIRDELYLDEFIIMPNHLHAIILLDSEQIVEPHGRAAVCVTNNTYTGTGKQLCTETHVRTSLRDADCNSEDTDNPRIFMRKPKSISSFIGGFKSATTIAIDNYIDNNNLVIQKYNRFNKFMQANYHDHIIRNEQEYYQIKNYIISNPIKWDDDKYHQS
ncbi:MAG: hypothetical protein KAH48_05350 [Chlorobi bacterium]|nr:hypothetical protein [Chlorobiota bacterium]